MRHPPAWHGQAWALKAAHPEMTMAEIGLKCCVSTTAVFNVLHDRRSRANAANRARAGRHHIVVKARIKTDPCSQLGAERLVQEIKAYWLERGYEIEAKAVEQPFTPTMRARRWDVVTNLVNGLPPNYTGPCVRPHNEREAA